MTRPRISVPHSVVSPAVPSDTSSSNAFETGYHIRGKRLWRAAPGISIPTNVPLLIEQIRLNSTEPLHAMPPLRHHLFGVILEGEADGQYRLHPHAETHPISGRPGTAYSIKIGSDGHWGWSAVSCTVMLVYVPPALVHHTGAAYGFSPARTALRTEFVVEDQFRYLLASAIAGILDTATPAADTLTQSVIQTLVLRAITDQEDASSLLDAKDGPLLLPVRRRLHRYIRTHLEDGLSVSDLAAHVDMSLAYFSRLFKRTVGLTPYQYVLRERVRWAQHLLETTDTSIAEIALRVGFANQSHLTRRFRAITHTTPGTYRRAVRAAQAPSE